eukprot:1095381-Prorocentrum_minimum.AAC.2
MANGITKDFRILIECTYRVLVRGCEEVLQRWRAGVVTFAGTHPNPKLPLTGMEDTPDAESELGEGALISDRFSLPG